jgi:hypothetical protein
MKGQALKILGDVVDAGETIWLKVSGEDFASSQALSDAMDGALSAQIEDLIYLYAERNGEVSVGGPGVELVLSGDGGDGAYGEWVKARGFGEVGRVVHVALDFGLEEVRILVD